MQNKRKNNFGGAASAFLVIGFLLLGYSLIFGLQIAAFIGLGLAFWGALFALARNGKYVESSLLDITSKSTYSTADRMINDLKLNGQAYYLPAYAQDINLLQYHTRLKEPVVFISELSGERPSIEELTIGKFLGEKTRGVFIASPGSGIMSQIEKELRLDFSKLDINDLTGVLPKYLTEYLNLARNINLTVSGETAILRASGVLYGSLYRSDPPLKSLSILGCPIVSAVASSLAKSSGKIVTVNIEFVSPKVLSVAATFNFIKE